ncbi:MAG: hypothetical protein ACPGO3_06250 [Magnetospiraceae bacterium]
MPTLKSKLAFAELEEAYDLLADAIDQAGEAKETLFLTKLALGLVSQVDGLETARAVIAASLNDLGKR